LTGGNCDLDYGAVNAGVFRRALCRRGGIGIHRGIPASGGWIVVIAAGGVATGVSTSEGDAVVARLKNLLAAVLGSALALWVALDVLPHLHHIRH
jgi:hypothetical protein